MTFCSDPNYHDHGCPGYALDRIADALDRIADALDALAPRQAVSEERLAEHLADVCGPQAGADWNGAARGLTFLLRSDGFEIVRGVR